MARPRTTPLPVLPPELWLYIHRIALADLWPETQADAVTYHLEGVPKLPLNDRDLHRYLKAVMALRRVCRHWRTLTQDLLYPHIWLNYSRNWSYISNAVSQPHIAAFVRNVRLSPTRFDHNFSLLQRCASHIELVVQPEFPRTERVFTGPLDEPLPDLPSLNHVYWIESAWSTPLLLAVLRSAVKLQHLAISSSSSIDSSFFRSASFPPLSRLRSLLVIGLPRTDISAFLRHSHLTSLEELTISPMYLMLQLPSIPTLRTLILANSYYAASTVSFAVILDLFPQLMELRYSLASSLIPPTGGQSAASLTCVHLLSHNRPPHYSIDPHCLLFLGPALGALERVVLAGPGWVGSQALEWKEWQSIKDRGCIVEMEERLAQ